METLVILWVISCSLICEITANPNGDGRRSIRKPCPQVDCKDSAGNVGECFDMNIQHPEKICPYGKLKDDLCGTKSCKCCISQSWPNDSDCLPTQVCKVNNGTCHGLMDKKCDGTSLHSECFNPYLPFNFYDNCACCVRNFASCHKTCQDGKGAHGWCFNQYDPKQADYCKNGTPVNKFCNSETCKCCLYDPCNGKVCYDGNYKGRCVSIYDPLLKKKCSKGTLVKGLCKSDICLCCL